MTMKNNFKNLIWVTFNQFLSLVLILITVPTVLVVSYYFDWNLIIRFVIDLSAVFNALFFYATWDVFFDNVAKIKKIIDRRIAKQNFKNSIDDIFD